MHAVRLRVTRVTLYRIRGAVETLLLDRHTLSTRRPDAAPRSSCLHRVEHALTGRLEPRDMAATNPQSNAVPNPRFVRSGIFRPHDEIHVGGTILPNVFRGVLADSATKDTGSAGPSPANAALPGDRSGYAIEPESVGSLPCGCYRVCVEVCPEAYSTPSSLEIRHICFCSTFCVVEPIGCQNADLDGVSSDIYTLQDASGDPLMYLDIPMQGKAYWSSYGPSAVVLFTHGAHIAAYADDQFFSTQYDYLMRCLALEGYLAISIRSGVGTSPANRANMMLYHLIQLNDIPDLVQNQFVLQSDTPIILAGHSRGGQAAALAAAAVKAGDVPDISDIAAVFTLAPSNEEAVAPEWDSFDSYLLLAGTHDGDVDKAKSAGQFNLIDPYIPYAGFLWIHRATHSGFYEAVSILDGDSNLASSTTDGAISREAQHIVTTELVISFLRWRVFGDETYAELFHSTSLGDFIEDMLPEPDRIGFRVYAHFYEDHAKNPPCPAGGCYFTGFMDNAPEYEPMNALDSDCLFERKAFRLQWDNPNPTDEPMLLFDLLSDPQILGNGPDRDFLEFDIAPVVRSSVSSGQTESVAHVSYWAAEEGNPWGELSTISVAVPAGEVLPSPDEAYSATVPATFRIPHTEFGDQEFLDRVQVIVVSFPSRYGDVLITRPRFF